MVDYKPTIMTDIRKWLWAELKTHNVLTQTDYTSAPDGLVNLNPIIPVSQEIEFADQFGESPHIVYDFIPIEHDPNLWMLSCAQVLFKIYAIKYEKLIEIRNLIEDLFRRQQYAAEDLNAMPGKSTLFYYANIALVEATEAEPRKELNGRMSAEIVTEIHYIRNILTVGAGRGRYA